MRLKRNPVEPLVEPELAEGEEYETFSGLHQKTCPACKAQNTEFATRCVDCNFSPLTWRPEYKGMLWVLLVVSIGLIVYTAYYR